MICFPWRRWHAILLIPPDLKSPWGHLARGHPSVSVGSGVAQRGRSHGRRRRWRCWWGNRALTLVVGSSGWVFRSLEAGTRSRGVKRVSVSGTYGTRERKMVGDGRGSKPVRSKSVVESQSHTSPLYSALRASSEQARHSSPIGNSDRVDLSRVTV